MQKHHPEFIFWAYHFESWTLLTQSFSNAKLLFCAISQEGVRIKNPSGIVFVDFPLRLIKNCHIVYGRRSLIAQVSILTDDQNRITLIPINPFDPPLFFHRNDNEAQTMIEVINSLQNGKQPLCNVNPYVRQLTNGDVPHYAVKIQENWSAVTSPWIYYYSNMQNLDWKRQVNVFIARCILIIGSLTTILMIIYIFYYLLSK